MFIKSDTRDSCHLKAAGLFPSLRTPSLLWAQRLMAVSEKLLLSEAATDEATGTMSRQAHVRG